MTQQNIIPVVHQPRILALDYLRVIAVGILFFYHLCMIWVPEWNFHFKQETDWNWLQHLMMLTSPWRMGLLWFISGTSLYVMQRKWGIRFLLTSRSNAILLPLLFGLLFIVPVQLFVEMTQKGAIDSTFWEFVENFYFGSHDYFEGFSAGVWHHVDVNHLWFLRSLWRFTLVLVILQYPISQLQKRFGTFNFKWLGLLVVVSLIVMNVDNSDLKRDIYGFTCLFFGYIFGTSEQFWNWLKERVQLVVICAICLILTYQIIFLLFQLQLVEEVLIVIGLFSYNASKGVTLIAILAIAHRVFTKKSSIICKANKYVFPLYVIHQSVLIIIAFLVASLGLSAIYSLTLTLVISIIICVICLSVSKYSALLGMLLGKRPREDSWFHTQSAQVVITVISLPLALRLLSLI
jgi:hypothetical protein